MSSVNYFNSKKGFITFALGLLHLLLYIQYVQHWHNIACMLASALAEMVTVFQDHNTLNLVLLKPGGKNKNPQQFLYFRLLYKAGKIMAYK